jgi:hypothetical protein
MRQWVENILGFGLVFGGVMWMVSIGVTKENDLRRQRCRDWLAEAETRSDTLAVLRTNASTDRTAAFCRDVLQR